MNPQAQRPTSAFVGASWLGLIVGTASLTNVEAMNLSYQVAALRAGEKLQVLRVLRGNATPQLATPAANDDGCTTPTQQRICA
jgi:hypothetical protein